MGARPSNGSPPAPDVAAKCGSWQGERDGSGEARCAWLERVPNAGAKLGQ